MNYVQSCIVCANVTIQGSHYFYKNTNSTVNGTNTPVHFFRNTYFLWSLFNLDFLKCYFLTWWPLKTTCQHHHLMKLLESGTDCRQTATRFPLSGSTSQWPLIKRTETHRKPLCLRMLPHSSWHSSLLCIHIIKRSSLPQQQAWITFHSFLLVIWEDHCIIIAPLQESDCEGPNLKRITNIFYAQFFTVVKLKKEY